MAIIRLVVQGAHLSSVLVAADAAFGVDELEGPLVRERQGMFRAASPSWRPFTSEALATYDLILSAGQISLQWRVWSNMRARRHGRGVREAFEVRESQRQHLYGRGVSSS